MLWPLEVSFVLCLCCFLVHSLQYLDAFLYAMHPMVYHLVVDSVALIVLLLQVLYWRIHIAMETTKTQTAWSPGLQQTTEVGEQI